MRKATVLFVIVLIGFGVFTATVNLCRNSYHPCCRPATADCHLKTMPIASADRDNLFEVRWLDSGFAAVKVVNCLLLPFADGFSLSAFSDVKTIVNSSLIVKLIHPCEAPPLA